MASLKGKILVSVLALGLTAVSANAQRVIRDRGDLFDFDYNDSRPTHGQQIKIERTRIGNYFDQYQNLKVKKELQLRQHHGKKIKFVEIEAEASQRGTFAQLVINGRSVGMEQKIKPYRRGGSTARFEVPRHMNVLGDDIRTLQVKFTDEVFVQSLKAGIKKARGHQRPLTLEADLHEVVNGPTTLSLSDLVNAPYRLEDKTVKSIRLVVRKKGQRGALRLCETSPLDFYFGSRHNSLNCSQGQRLMAGRNVIELDGMGTALGDLELKMRGDLVIKKIKIELSRR